MQGKLLNLVLLLCCSCLRLKEIYYFLLLLVPLRNLPEYKSLNPLPTIVCTFRWFSWKCKSFCFGAEKTPPKPTLKKKKGASKVVIKVHLWFSAISIVEKEGLKIGSRHFCMFCTSEVQVCQEFSFVVSLQKSLDF